MPEVRRTSRKRRRSLRNWCSLTCFFVLGLDQTDPILWSLQPAMGAIHQNGCYATHAPNHAWSQCLQTRSGIDTHTIGAFKLADLRRSHAYQRCQFVRRPRHTNPPTPHAALGPSFNFKRLVGRFEYRVSNDPAVPICRSYQPVVY